MVGEHLILDIYKIHNKEKLVGPEGIETTIEFFSNLLKKNNFKVLGIQEHLFENKAYTLIFLLSESHLSFHSWPEINWVSVDFFSCKLDFKLESLVNSFLLYFNGEVYKKIIIER